ncbi:DUF3223 domain-containing protein [Streptomyces sp. NPDC048508]|uniref:DUF3223 domain-containing protein n=1 Tax=Streptomyces sp. NPDC048508 TaxID=3365561 RepID=UPI00372344AF
MTDSAHIEFLTALFARHPEAAEKIASGIGGFKVQVNPEGTANTRRFYAVHSARSATHFSFSSCL